MIIIKIKATGIIVVAFIFIQVIIGIFIISSIEPTEIDIVKINDITQSCLEAVEIDNFDNTPKTEYSYSVLGVNNNLLYRSGNASTTIDEAIKHKDLMIDIKTENGEIKGKLIIKNNDMDSVIKNKSALLLLLIMTDIVVVIIIMAYYFYVKKSILAPFDKLKGFAIRVAGGNLDLPLNMDKGNLFGAFTESFDIMRDELKKSRQNEQAADKSKKELVAKLSHDIKTPVASIKAIAEVLSVQTTDKKVLDQLSIIDLKANQIDLLITNLFNVTIEDLQELDITTKEYESTVIYDMLKISDYKGKVIFCDILQCIVSFDYIRLQQVFDNIIENSYKYADTDINITSTLDDNMLLISISDNGGGVCDKDLLFVTNKFYRGDNSTGKSGSGLGLYISKLILSQMGGSFEVKNTENGFLTIIGLKI